MVRWAIIAAAALVLSGCAGGGSVGGPAASASSARSAPTGAVASGAFRAPQVMRERALDSIIGQHASALSRRFGQARIDLVEGDARKLQYVSDACVLDIYFYPLEANGDPVATHVEARARQGGTQADRANCIAEVERQARL